jgi:hypothetical protein
MSWVPIGSFNVEFGNFKILIRNSKFGNFILFKNIIFLKV